MKRRFILSFCCTVCSCLAHAQGLSVVFKEDFANNNRLWHVEYIGSRSTFLQDETYIQEGYNNRVVCYATQLVQLDPAKNFKINVQTRHLGGRMDKPYGFSFGPNRKGATYYFTIAADGRFSVFNGTKKIIDWRIGETIHPRDNENKLTIEKEDTTCYIYINDQKVTSFPIENFKPGELFFIGLYTKGQQKVEFDDILVYAQN